ncbi:MAG TPA: serine protease [Solirubrobacteraceae bacterium]|nr:serine protease [Solirubrobacteraceae bacterium]
MAARRRNRSATDVVERFRQVIPDVERMDEVLGDDPGESLAAAAQSPLGARGPGDGEPDSEVFARTGEAARSAMKKIRADGADAALEPEELHGAEAIIELYGRPAILVQDGHFMAPSHPWEKLEDHREAIEATLESVGRIEIDGHPALDWVGTGFLVAEDVVVTNRHVAKEFSRQGADMAWIFEPGMVARVDFAEELGDSRPREFELTELIGISDDFDMAFLRAAKSGDAGAIPPPIALAPQTTVASGRDVYVVGYPASDSRRNDPEEQRRIFANVFDVKRLQPGQIVGVESGASLFLHDCSTLGGNSGSCVVDLETHQILGLHFSGRYLVNNKAIALSTCPDPLIQRAGLVFA